MRQKAGMFRRSSTHKPLCFALLALVLVTVAHAQTVASRASTATPTATTAAAVSTATSPSSSRTPAATNVTSAAATIAPSKAVADSPIEAEEEVVDTSLPTPSTGAVKGDPKGLLTTKAQANGPTIFVDAAGDEVIFKGIGWYGFNIGLAALGNLTAGPDAVANDFKQVVYRQRMLGFNSIRVAFAFDDVGGINSPPVDWSSNVPCDVPTQTQIRSTLKPGTAATTTLEKNSNSLPPLAPPEVTNGVCNNDWPQDSTYQRFVWVVQYLISEGFYVMLDFHANRYLDSIALGNESLYNQASWIQSWVALLKTILDNVPAAHGRLLIDLINEPDGFALTWEDQGRVPSVGSYYLNTIDALYEVCPGCLYLIEGTGQTTVCGVNWGNGFITDQSILKPLDLTSPSSFFTSVLSRPWLKQVVLAPHIYCPEVSGATECFSGQPLYDALDKSFGYLTVSPGFCSGSNCHVFPAILDEFGSTLDNTNETTCMASIIQYATGAVNSKTHAPLTSWYFWSWQPDSMGTGGMVTDDWKTIVWEKVGLLTGGTKNWKTGLNLLPWYLEDFKDLTPIDTGLDNSTITVAAKAPSPVEPPVVAAPISSIDNPSQETQAQIQTQTPVPTIPAGFIGGNNTVVSAASGPTNVESLQTFGATTSLSNGDKLSTGALAGIIVGAVVLVAVIAAAAILIIRLRNPRTSESYTPTSSSQSPLATVA